MIFQTSQYIWIIFLSVSPFTHTMRLFMLHLLVEFSRKGCVFIVFYTSGLNIPRFALFFPLVQSDSISFPLWDGNGDRSLLSLSRATWRAIPRALEGDGGGSRGRSSSELWMTLSWPHETPQTTRPFSVAPLITGDSDALSSCRYKTRIKFSLFFS